MCVCVFVCVFVCVCLVEPEPEVVFDARYAALDVKPVY